MRRKKSHRSIRSSKKSSLRSKDISPQTLMAMVILVLVISFLSVGMYVYTFYGNNSPFQIPNSLSKNEIYISQEQPASGTASIEIVKPPEER